MAQIGAVLVSIFSKSEVLYQDIIPGIATCRRIAIEALSHKLPKPAELRWMDG